MSDETLLYDGTVKLSFDSAKHVYRVQRLRRPVLAEFEKALRKLPPPGDTAWSAPQIAPSITSILKVIGKGDALTQWAANCAADYIRETVRPGEPLDEIGISQLADGARFAFRRKSKEACDIGALVHAWIEKYLVEWHSGRPAPDMPANEEARRSCNAALKWLTDHDYRPMLQETRLYSLKYGYAGTCDAQGIAASVNGKLCICDWKSSKAIYEGYFLQVAAYCNAFEEMTGQCIHEAWIVRVGKDGTLEDRRLSKQEIKKSFKAFLAAKSLYDWMKDYGYSNY